MPVGFATLAMSASNQINCDPRRLSALLCAGQFGVLQLDVFCLLMPYGYHSEFT